MSNLVIEEIAYHRNGVSGVGFHVVKFSEPSEERQMLAVLFDTDEWGHVAVFDRKLLGRDIIKFGENSWRGDHYEKELRQAIAAHEAARDAALNWRAADYEAKDA